MLVLKEILLFFAYSGIVSGSSEITAERNFRLSPTTHIWLMYLDVAITPSINEGAMLLFNLMFLFAASLRTEEYPLQRKRLMIGGYQPSEF